MTNATIEPGPSAPPASASATVPEALAMAPGVFEAPAADVVAVTIEGSQALVEAQFRALRAGTADGARQDLDTELGARLGPHFAVVRAALPDAARARFNAQLAARASVRANANATIAAPESERTEAELRTLVRAASSGGDDVVVAQSALATLARYVADHGPRPVAEALRYERPSLYGGASNVPVRPAERRGERRDGERRDGERQKDRRTADRAVFETEPSTPLPADRPQTLDDVVQRAGETIAVHRHDMRNFTWPSYCP